MREVVKFNGKPAEIELAYSTGKEGQNDNGSFYTYTLAGDKVMFASPTLNQKIQALNPYKGMRLSVQLMKNNQWDVRAIDPPAEPPRPQPPVAAPAVQQAPVERNYGQSNGTTPKPAAPTLMTGQSQFILQQMIAAIEASYAAEKYAAAMGRPIQFTSEDVRCFAISCFISADRNGGR